jgi:hypothetical protein
MNLGFKPCFPSALALMTYAVTLRSWSSEVQACA